MRILHTSDWHLGRTLYGRRRYEEFEAFLDWMAENIEQRGVEALLIAGDVFDTTTPSNRAQELYYRFLCRVAASECRHVVIVAGNHDSPSFLNAPRELLRVLNVHVIGSVPEDPGEEVLTLRSLEGAPEMIVCAVPYLRDREVRAAEAGETPDDKVRKLIEGIQQHYRAVAKQAEQQRRDLGADLPIVAMGHLFTAGGQTLEGDGVRELYVGSLAHVSARSFPESFDYLALGHLHVPQKVNGSETMRYSGSPLPMGFGEARQQKSLCQVDFQGTTASVSLIEIPRFQQLERVRGDWDSVAARLNELASQDSQAWLEVHYEGTEILGDLRERLEDLLRGTRMELLRVQNHQVLEGMLQQLQEGEELGQLSLEEVFERCLLAHEVPEEQRPELRQTYAEVLKSLHEDDLQAE
ncbi:MAG: exonuclease SbcCD subunit D C-terminal domain-containing protein [bacterium]